MIAFITAHQVGSRLSPWPAPRGNIRPSCISCTCRDAVDEEFLFDRGHSSQKQLSKIYSNEIAGDYSTRTSRDIRAPPGVSFGGIRRNSWELMRSFSAFRPPPDTLLSRASTSCNFSYVKLSESPPSRLNMGNMCHPPPPFYFARMARFVRICLVIPGTDSSKSLRQIER